MAGGPGLPEGFNRGFYVKPTVFADVIDTMTLAQQEVFGPVMAVLDFETEEEVIATMDREAERSTEGLAVLYSDMRAHRNPTRMKVLRAEGVENAMVNGGGDVLTHGLWQGRAWRVGLRDPRAPERLLGVVPVAGTGVVASSGDYERFFFHAGQRQHHVLNPRTGRPSSGVHGVSLVARDVAAVNGLGAALMVQGPQAGRALAQRMPGLAVLIAGQDGGVWQSTAMSALLEPVPS